MVAFKNYFVLIIKCFFSSSKKIRGTPRTCWRDWTPTSIRNTTRISKTCTSWRVWSRVWMWVDLCLWQLQEGHSSSVDSFVILYVYMQDQAKAMDYYDDRVKALQKRSQQVLPLKFRRETPQKLLPVEALCDFESEGVRPFSSFPLAPTSLWNSYWFFFCFEMFFFSFSNTVTSIFACFHGDVFLRAECSCLTLIIHTGTDCPWGEVHPPPE